MDTLPALASTFALAFFYFVGAIPAGVALKLPPLLAACAACASYIAGVLIVVLAGAPLRAWLMRRLRINPQPDETRLFWRIWNRYGALGLGLLAPVTLGSQTGALIGLALGVPPARLLATMTLGALVWSAVIAVMLAFGLGALG